MNDNFLRESSKPTHTYPAYRVGDRAFDNEWNELKVTCKNGWKYLKRGDKHIGLNKLADKTGYSEPINFGYIFKGLFQEMKNEYYDSLY